MKNNLNKINGKRPQGIYTQMLAMKDFTYPNLTREYIDKIFNQI